MNASEKDKFSISVRGVAIKDGKILLVKEREEKRLETPGGRIKHGESIENALKREFLEETGYDIEIVKPIHVYNRYDYVFVIFLVKLKKKITEPLPDVVEMRWLSKKETKEFLESDKVDDHDVEVFRMFVRGDLEK